MTEKLIDSEISSEEEFDDEHICCYCFKILYDDNEDWSFDPETNLSYCDICIH
jgi:hypothetical protein